MFVRKLKKAFRRAAGRLTDADIIANQFDSAWYLAQNPDVVQSGLNPIRHFLNHGWYEGRRPRPDFDPSWYVQAYPDVAASGENPFVHFVREGLSQGRKTAEEPGRMAEDNLCTPALNVPSAGMYFRHCLASREGRIQARLERAFAERAA